MVPDFLDIEADHVQTDFFMDSMNFVLDTVGIIALHLLLVGGFNSNDEELLEYFNQHLFESLVTWLDIHFAYPKSINC